MGNELPDATGSGDEGTGDDGTGTSDQPVGDGGHGNDAVLSRVLEVLDGEILEQRVAGGQNAGGSGSGNGPAGALPGSASSAALPGPPPVARAPQPLPPDTPDARDDDVVARQIREAAMAEKDPELRESLWEEYRRYKSGL